LVEDACWLPVASGHTMTHPLTWSCVANPSSLSCIVITSLLATVTKTTVSVSAPSSCVSSKHFRVAFYHVTLLLLCVHSIVLPAQSESHTFQHFNSTRLSLALSTASSSQSNTNTIDLKSIVNAFQLPLPLPTSTAHLNVTFGSGQADLFILCLLNDAESQLLNPTARSLQYRYCPTELLTSSSSTSLSSSSSAAGATSFHSGLFNKDLSGHFGSFSTLYQIIGTSLLVSIGLAGNYEANVSFTFWCLVRSS
jgi:hypothetical protein